MASSRSKPNSPLQSTRQMLDELDALMDRMLALPVGDAEDLPPLPRDVPMAPKMTAMLTHAQESGAGDQESGVRGQQPGDSGQESGVGSQESGARSQESGLSELATQEKEGSLVPSEFSLPPRFARNDPPRLDNGTKRTGPHFAPPMSKEPPAQESGVRSQESGVEGQGSGARGSESGVEQAIRPAKEVSSRPAPAIDSVSLTLLPLVWINQAFDLCSVLLGPIGPGLRGQRGRSFLGIVGLLCLGLAGAWLIFDQISGR